MSHMAKEHLGIHLKELQEATNETSIKATGIKASVEQWMEWLVV